MTTLNKIYASLKKANNKKVDLSLMSDIDNIDTVLREDIIGQASDSFPIYATNTVFYLLQEDYNEIRERVKGVLSEYGYEESYKTATTLEGFAQDEITKAENLLKTYQNMADEIGLDINSSEVMNSKYGSLLQSIDWAKESIRYMTNMDWKSAYDDIKKLENF